MTEDTLIQTQPRTIGWIIALAIMLLAVVFAAIGQLDLKIAAFIVGLAAARLL